MTGWEDEARRTAIEHHHDFAPVFEARYREMAVSRFTTAFAYGRAKVDQLLEHELKTLAPNSTLLDVGCGTGTYLARFKELGFTAIGVEPAEGMLACARRDNPGVRVEQGVVTALPLEDASCDFVSVIEVFRYLHLADTRAGLAECFRVLKPGGTIFFTIVNRWALDGFYVYQRLRQIALGKRFTRRHPHCEFFTPSEIKRELESVGFVDQRVMGRLFAPIRLAYKAAPRLAARVARIVEPVDDLIHELPVTTPFAGHLVVVARRPA